MKKRKKERGGAKPKTKVRRRRASRRRTRSVKPGALTLADLVPKVRAMKLTDFFRPLKKPVTLRLDADVIAWFKKDGRRYQTRINQALRKVMEREMRAGI